MYTFLSIEKKIHFERIYKMSDAEANRPQFGVERVISLLKNKIHEVLDMQRKNIVYLRKKHEGSTSVGDLWNTDVTLSPIKDFEAS